MLTKTKIALATVLVLGTATAAFAEDSSSSFPQNIYGQLGQTQTFEGRNVALTARNVALPNGRVINVQRTNDRASSPNAGGGF
jgi:hypothetical protein